MTDITATIESTDSPTEIAGSPTENIANQEPIKLSQTRSFTWEFLLTCSTFTVYSVFYLIARTHELNKLDEKRFKPWLWIFSLSPVISLFSLPILHSALTRLEAKYQPSRNKKWDIAIILIMLLSNHYLAISSKVLTPIWFDCLILVVWSISFAFFAKRISALKHAVPNISWKRENIFKVTFKWLLSIILIPIYIVAIVYEVTESYQLKDVPRFNTNTFTAVSLDQRASLKFFEQDWYQADIGTFSDGSTEAEFSSINSSNYLLLFTYSDTFELLDAHMQDRKSWIEESLGQAKCTNNKYSIGDQFFIKSDLICTGRTLGDDSIKVISVIETPNKTYELLGEYSAPEYEFEKQNQKFVKMVKEFKVQ
ncbi:hypothetical protein [Vibrio sp. 99-70-13A1]|uniref:hypothetical protein n=1 Tax=Vibrio sp. 99-70-13A1 TaxID=2607601 RepID=UPI0014937AE5|nr:hypothetical protein [Vibrio sp. 99-70-13A1]NOH95383.1 hypothetical protein [Vibrio sp. 99-70-13A1]